MNEETSMVFVVDDDDAVRRALTRQIRGAGYCVQSFGSALEFLESGPYSHSCTCLVLDVGLPGLNGLELQREMNAANTPMPIIFLTGRADISMTVRAMKAGATDFLTKPVCDADLMRAIDNALRQSSRALSNRAELDRIHGRMARLTPREREVLMLVVEGCLNKQVAYKLGIGEKTIKVHRARVMEKMEARSFVELVRFIDKVSTPLSPGQVA